MAQVNFAVNNALSNEGWEKQLYAEVIEATSVFKFTGSNSGGQTSDASSLLQIKDFPNSNAGSKVTCGLRGLLTGDGKQGDEVLEGDEEAFDTFDDALFIDELRHAVKVPGGGTIDAQRVPYNLRAEGYDAGKQWYSERIDESFFNQICGYTPASAVNTKRTGNQAAIAPSANNIIRPGGKTTDEGLLAADTISLTQIDALRERAETMRDQFSQPIIKPFKFDGDNYYVLFVHDYQVTDLRRDAGDGGWLQLHRDAVQGGAMYDSPIWKGSLGVYNKVILHKSTRVTQGVNSSDATAAVTTARRAVMCGAQAAWLSWGQSYGESAFRWVEKLTDYQKALGIAFCSVWGLKKSVFDSKDFGTIVLSTRAEAHDI